jgi:hypothetical protein
MRSLEVPSENYAHLPKTVTQLGSLHSNRQNRQAKRNGTTAKIYYNKTTESLGKQQQVKS